MCKLTSEDNVSIVSLSLVLQKYSFMHLSYYFVINFA